MDIHNIDQETGVYLGTSQADESPLEPGEFLIPAHAVTVAPPAVAAGERARWVGSAWVVEAVPVDIPTEQPAPTPEEIRAAQQAAILGNIAALEAQQARPLREVLLAQLAGQQPPQFSADKLADIEAQITAQRALLAVL